MPGITRRAMIQKYMVLALGCLRGNLGWSWVSDVGRRLVILHTNDTHPALSIPGLVNKFSRDEELLIARYEKIKQIRAEGIPVLLLDSGDFTGTNPNILTNELPPTWRALHIMGYDAVAMGDGDLAAGVDMFELHWEKVGIPILACNYTLKETLWEKWVRPYCIVDKGNIRIGIIGLGLPLSNRLPASVSLEILQDNPIKSANACVMQLQKQGCELIICLSHLGDQSSTEMISDYQLAQENIGIDIIIGAHTHRLYEQPRKFTNKIGAITILHQMGSGGGYLGRLDCFFQAKGSTKTLKANRLHLEKKIAE